VDLSSRPHPLETLRPDGAAPPPRTVSVLGSTGSIGRQTLSLLEEPGRFVVRALVAGRNAALLAEQARRFRPELVVIEDEAAYPDLRAALAGTGIEVAAGREAVEAAAALPADWTMAAITGAAGLAPTLRAIEGGRTVALANKEALVCAGDLMLEAVARAGTTLLPVDSEHNAIFQALADGARAHLEKITLTASGGPFRTASLEEMRAARPEAALKHPVWAMGAKITIDSATLMNKGLEVIEAARLFGLAEEEIDVLIHPQSVIHGMVHFRDGSVLAQLGPPDMRVPIAHTLAWPARMTTPAPRLDLAALGRLEFYPPDEARFPALRLARAALRAGGAAPTLLNAANEVAVAAFLAGRIGFLDIPAVVGAVLDEMGAPALPDLPTVMALDREARRRAEEVIARR
jgi:1-deoxy-D-xylulose-5-phosphate reductoisomerase